jgi:glycosyltransferase involved in cell wall biosynthesis
VRIIQLVQKPQLRGAEIFAAQLSSQLTAFKQEVIMVCLQPGRSALPFEGEIIHLDRPGSSRLWDWEGWGKLAKIVKEFDPDIIQANAGDTLKYAVMSKLFFRWNAPIIYRNANKVSDFIDSFPKKVFNKFLVNRVDHVVSVSELCRQDLIKLYAFHATHTTTIPIGLNLSPVNRHLASDLTAVFSSGKVMVHVASFVPEKNHVGLLRIVKRLLDSGQNIKLILIGDGKLRNAVEEQIRQLKLDNHVFTLGYRTDVMTIVDSAHVFVLPSLIEGLPGVILEAMYCKTPVVTYNVGGISEVVRNGETGWLVPPGDEDGFIRAVGAVLNTDVTSIVNNAHELVVREFDNKVIAERFLEVYKMLSRDR